jgi:hypothetical protein
MIYSLSSLSSRSWVRLLLVFLLTVAPGFSADSPAEIFIRNFEDKVEAEALIAATRHMPIQTRVERISEYFLGRQYHPDTKARLAPTPPGKKNRKPKKKKEATNPEPIPVKIFPTSLTHLDCMTYVEHVLAFAAADKPDYTGSFLPRLVDVMYDSGGKPLFSHQRKHFTSVWGDRNERKGYLINVARGHPLAQVRKVLLNKVGTNRTFYVEDRFMISSSPQTVHYFPTAVVSAGKAPLASGDVLALVTHKEGLDVTHMAFYIEKDGRRIFRHASLLKNRVIDDDFLTYVQAKKGLLGIMVFRPTLKVSPPSRYRFHSHSAGTEH